MLDQAGVILVLDDNAMLQQYVRKILAGKGYGVIEAADAETGFDAIQRRGDITLVLADIIITPTGPTGIEFCDEVKKIRPEMKFILMSGYDRRVLGPKSDWVFLQKPFPPDDLLETVRKVLGTA